MTASSCLRVFMVAAGALGFAPALFAADAPDVQVRTSLSRTAIWVGDRVAYTVEIACRKGVDVLDEDLGRDKLKLDGLEIVSADTSLSTASDGAITRRVTYTLTTYRVDQPQLHVAPLSVRYYAKRPGQRLQDAAPAGEAQVPGAVVALRSTLPDQADTATFRTERAPAPRALPYALAQPVGVGLVVASVAPVAFLGVAIAARRRTRVVHRSVRQVRRDERDSLESVRAMDLSSPSDRRDAYTRINEVVRQHLREICGVAGHALTPAEVAPALSSRAGKVPADTVAALLAECELARYAPPDALPSPEACRDAIGSAEQVLAAR